MSLRNSIVSDPAAPEYVAVVTRYGANSDAQDGEGDTIILAVFHEDAPRRPVLSTTAHGRAGLLSWADLALGYPSQAESGAVSLSALAEDVAARMLRVVWSRHAS